MRTVYLGTSAFGAAVLERVAASDHRPALVVTRPDRPRGRGRRMASPPVAATARGLSIDVLQPESVNSQAARGAIAEAAPDAVLICAFGGLIAEPLLSDHEMLNAHPSLLPRWRGAAPIERAIEAGDRETGVSIMRPVAELDAGPVCLVAREPIRADDDFGTLSARLEALAGDLLVRALDERPPWQPQPDDGITYADKVTREERRLAPELGAARLARRVRALAPHVGAYVEVGGGERLQVLRAAVAADGGRGHGEPGRHPAPGTLATVDRRLLFGCSGGALELLVVKPAGGRAMATSAYLRGHRPPAAAPTGEARESGRR